MKSRLFKLDVVKTLEPKEVWMLVKISLLLTFSVLGLRLWGFKRLSGWLGLSPSQRQPTYSSNQEVKAKRTAYLVNGVANRMPFHSTCLARSLVLWWLLKTKALHSQLHIGVTKSNGESQLISAHAWIEFNGIVLNDQPDVNESFHQIAVFSSRMERTI